GVGGVDDYLADDTSIPWDYTDPKADAGVNAFTNRITNTIAWDEAADNETKLEKIITQKWIAAYTDSMEPWVDHRRTDYPKLPFNYQNDSSPDWGIIAADDFLRRMTFIQSERTNNPEGVADATAKLGGPDEIGTRLWWDTGGPNF
ncbi:MAG: SusD/RagB family nutrient-binding outer membrane lipoprotein, partial [Allomuricauda sp.]